GMGECHVHAALTPAEAAAKRREYPDAEFLVHPECGCTTSAMYYAAADGDVVAGRGHIVSTEQMTVRARTSPARRFVVATETGVLHRLRRALEEDRARDDVTTRLLGAAAGRAATAAFLAEGRFVVAGLPLVGRVYAELDRAACLEPIAREGAWVEPGVVLARVRATAAT